MQELLTASIIAIPTAYALLLIVQFVLGLVALYNSKQPAAIALPVVEPVVETIAQEPIIEQPPVVITLPTAEPEMLSLFAPDLVLIEEPKPLLQTIKNLEVLTIKELHKE